MSLDWADKIAQQLSSRGIIERGICLILGGVDTGKTTLTFALAKQLAKDRPVGVIDADVGQSHIGPPTTVGWATIDKPKVDLSRLAASGISFVGDITPVGHLLQFTAAIVKGVQQISKVTELIIIDTPGFISGPAAAALWWNLQQILKPSLILAVQRQDELSDIISGLKRFELQLEQIESPPRIPSKSLQERQNYRKSRFNKYFNDARTYNINLSDIAAQPVLNFRRENFINRVVALRNEKGIDAAIGVITERQQDDNIMVVKAPPLDIDQIHCLIIGDVTIDITSE